MNKTILIACSKGPSADTWQEFCDVLKAEAYDMLVQVGRIGLCNGPGCANLSIEVSANELGNIELFANSVTMALMPSRWCFTEDEPIEGFQYVS